MLTMTPAARVLLWCACAVSLAAWTVAACGREVPQRLMARAFAA